MARNAGLFRSDDGGKTWDLATASLGLDQSVAATAVALPGDFEEDHTVICGLAGGVLVSQDGGKTWGLATFPPPPPMVTALALSPEFAQDGVALAATMQDGVLRSSDHGRNWILWNFGLLDLSVLCLGMSPEFVRDETIFAGTETGIFRSTNGGRAWREVELPVDYDPVLSLAVSPTFAQDGTIFAGTESKGLLVSRDGGDSWSRTGEQFVDEAVNAVLLAPDFAARPEVVVLSNGLVWISRDGGKQWQRLWAELENEGKEISTLYAPAGFQPGSPVWAGLHGGSILRLAF
jgi:photosystem II stability/assembly factor-like uncharacterized protein